TDNDFTKILNWPGYRVYRHEIDERRKKAEAVGAPEGRAPVASGAVQGVCYQPGCSNATVQGELRRSTAQIPHRTGSPAVAPDDILVCEPIRGTFPHFYFATATIAFARRLDCMYCAHAVLRNHFLRHFIRVHPA